MNLRGINSIGEPKRALPLLILVLLGVVTITYVFVTSSNRDKNPRVPEKAVAAQADKTDEHFASKDIELTTSLEPIGEHSDKTKIASGDTVRVKTIIRNASERHSRFLTVMSGVKSDAVITVQNLTGATGYIDEKGEIAFTNVAVQGRQQQEISFTAIAVTGDSDRTLIVKPSLIEASNKVVSTGKEVTYTITKSANKLNQTMYKITSEGGQ